MKKLSLLLLVIIALAIGCSEDNKIEKIPVKTIKKVAVTPKIKTVDELFVAIEEKFKDYKKIYPSVCFFNNKTIIYAKTGKIFLYDSKIINLMTNPITGNGLRSEFSEKGTVFYTVGEQPYWFLDVKAQLLKKRFYKYKSAPNMIVNKKTTMFKNFFEKFYLSDKKEQINGKDCYKLVAISNKNNSLKQNIRYIYWIECERLLNVKLKFLTTIDGKFYNYQVTNFYKKNTRGEYKISKVKSITTPTNSTKPYSEGIMTINKIVEGIPLDASIFKMPKDKNDYKNLQAYFNMLLKKYYDHKYQIEIKEGLK